MATMASTESRPSAIRSKGNSQVELGGARWSGRGCSGMRNRTGQSAGAHSSLPGVRRSGAVWLDDFETRPT